MYCDHKTLDNCPDCQEELIALRKEVKWLRACVEAYRASGKTPCKSMQDITKTGDQ